MSIFSQYTWGDFFKVVIPIVALYYAWVGWTYYREDIREWMTSRGQREPDSVLPEDETPEPDTLPSFMAVSDYRPQVPADVAADGPDEEAPSESIDEVAAAAPIAPVLTAYQPTDEPEVSISGPDLPEQPDEYIGVPMLGLQAENPLEQRVGDVLAAAQRLKTESDGVVVALDQLDQPAVALAAVVNNQKAREAFSDMSFTR